jgi:diguanylate cyclase (GGDEF)-like protein/PAS domain S-box-containing protein
VAKRPVGKAGTLHLRMLSNAMSGIRYISVISAEGTLVMSNELQQFIGRNFSHRDYFQAVKQHPSVDMLYVSPPYKSLLGPYFINVSRMLPGAHGEFAGIVTATLDPEYFKTLMTSALYAPDMWDAIAHGDGLLFLMEPEREGMQGMNLALPGTLFTRHRDSGKLATVFTDTVYATRERRMMAQHTVRSDALKVDKPLDVAVSRDLSMVLQPWRRTAMAQGGLYVLLVIISIAGLYAYQRRQRKFEQLDAEATAALRLSTERLQLATEASGVGVWDYDFLTSQLIWDDSMYAIYGLNRSAGSSYDIWNRSVLPEDRPIADAALKATLEQGVPYTPQFRIRRSDGAIRYIQARARIHFDTAGKPLRMVGTNEDVTEQKNLQEQLELQAHHDYLTGLPNRRHFMEQGELALAGAKRYGHALSLCMLDIDHFKHINDTYGHKAGDIVLQKLGHILRETLRTVDITGRMGGEEFAILMPETDFREAAEIAERLRETVSRSDVISEAGLPLHFSVSIGVAAMREKDVNMDMLINLADQALYLAKNSGRNKVCLAD